MSTKLIYDFSSRGAKSSLFQWRGHASNLSRGYKKSSKSTIHSKDQATNWDPDGPLNIDYKLNILRVPYLKDTLSSEKFSNDLKGMKILDVGCGGGYLSEALAKLGANVTGIDPNKSGIEYAKQSSAKNISLANNLPKYIPTTVEEHCVKNAGRYDAVIAAEVLDRVVQKELFVESCARAAKPGAKLFFSTINRSLLARITVMYGYENIFKIIPKGAHKYEMFIRPEELEYILDMNECVVKSVKGYRYYPFQKQWNWTRRHGVFYAMEAVKAS